MREQFWTSGFPTTPSPARQREQGRALTNIDGFLSLAGFIALLLGAIGVASAVHVYVRQKIGTVAILRCLGASAGQSFSVYLVQGIALGAFGSILGAVLGVGLQLALPPLVKDLLPFPVDFSIAWMAVARGMGAGLFICVLFTAASPDGGAERFPARRVARERGRKGRDGLGPVALRRAPGHRCLLVTGFAGLADAAASASASVFTAMLGFGFARPRRPGVAGRPRRPALVAAAPAPPWCGRAWPTCTGRTTAPSSLLVSLGLGTCLILTLFLVRTTLLREIQATGAAASPTCVFFDVQDDQIRAARQAYGGSGRAGDVPGRLRLDEDIVQ